MRDPMNSASGSIYNVDHENVSDGSNCELNDLLNNTKIHMFEQPNMGALRQERNERDRAAMKVRTRARASESEHIDNIVD